MTFLYLNSDKMGEGDPQLGKKLMRSFLSELEKSGKQVDAIGCVNSGIHLTTEGSEVIEILQKFEAKGTRIATCGTCLDHYKKRDKLLLGVIGTMDGTVEIMFTADKVIRPN
ncbi:MAG: sulfurtransferase-like selenium metabolism protein YedF [Deferribacteres bacterium]|nr:sulfurtransferase-like selenium metabolism protein YedF [candidate division KSB1 bacterium]MCB9501023.1 sulfurtransferase-like selenium metabolism protein YedF [Deferribacteres bacterium]